MAFQITSSETRVIMVIFSFETGRINSNVDKVKFIMFLTSNRINNLEKHFFR